MTGVLLKLLVIVLIFGGIWLGVRRIWRDWTGQFRAFDRQRRERDLREREQPGVITLERDKDGTFRPPGSGTRRD